VGLGSAYRRLEEGHRGRQKKRKRNQTYKELNGKAEEESDRRVKKENQKIEKTDGK
jgi:hypothetical protein